MVLSDHRHAYCRMSGSRRFLKRCSRTSSFDSECFKSRGASAHSCCAYSHEQLVLHNAVKAVSSKIIRVFRLKVGFKNENNLSFCKINPPVLTSASKLFSLRLSKRVHSRAGHVVAASRLKLSCHRSSLLLVAGSPNKTLWLRMPEGLLF
jgi:hypothetical protein